MKWGPRDICMLVLILGVLLLLGGLLVVCAWAQRVRTPLRLLMVSGLGMLSLLTAYVVAPQLPLAAQRTLAALPGIQLDQLSQCHPGYRRKSSARSGLVQPTCLVILEGRDHCRGWMEGVFVF